MNAEPSPEPPSRLRRLFSSAALAGALVFLAAFFTLPRLLAVLMTDHFTQNDATSLYVAVQAAHDTFELVPLSVPATLKQPAFVSDGDRPSAPHAAEPTGRARVEQRDGDSVLMETVWSSGGDVVTSRYLVTGRQVVPVTKKEFGLPQLVLGTLVAALLAVASAQLWARRRAGSVEPD